MAIKTDEELLAQIAAGIQVNGNGEITPPIHKAIEDNIVSSKLSIKDGGNVVQVLTGYATDLTPSDDKHFIPKKYFDDNIPDVSGLVPTTRTITINGVDQDLSANREWRTSQAVTGCFTFAGLTVASGTTVNIGAVEGQIVDNETDPQNPTYIDISYPGESNKTVTTVGSGLGTYVLLDNTGTVVFQNTFPDSSERKTMIYLAKIGHPSGTIIVAGNEPDFVSSPLAQFRDLFQALNYVNDGIYPSPDGANLSFQISGGNIHGNGINFVNDRTIPNELAVAPSNPASFIYRTKTGAGGGFVTVIDPTSYDLAGVITAIPGSSNQATNVWIFYVPGIGLGAQYGQTIYATLDLAKAAVGKETSFVIYPSFVRNSILIGVLSITKGCTNLNTTTTAFFSRADKFGQIVGASGGGGSLTDGDYGDIVVSGSGTIMTIDSNAATYTKVYNGFQLALVQSMKSFTGN